MKSVFLFGTILGLLAGTPLTATACALGFYLVAVAELASAVLRYRRRLRKGR